MTKEQVIKHKEVIKWWLDNTDKGVWLRLSNGWEYSSSPQWHTECKYVQNDEYAELRKAQADGKIIQERDSSEIRDKFYDSKPSWSKPVHNYRIKPAEPKFKVGDWVRSCYGGIYLIKECDDTRMYHNAGGQYSLFSDLHKWQPQEGDVVVCWTEDFSAFIREVIVIPDDDDMTLAVGLDEGYALISQLEHCIPYIGQDFSEMV